MNYLNVKKFTSIRKLRKFLSRCFYCATLDALETIFYLLARVPQLRANGMKQEEYIRKKYRGFFVKEQQRKKFNCLIVCDK